MKMYRLMGILLMLENEPLMTAKTLADHFEVSVRTIYRDIDVLSQAGFSIVTESGHGGGISLMNAKRIQLEAMSENEFLKLIQKVIAKDSNDEISENIALKIRSQLSEESQQKFDRLKKATLVDHKAWDGSNHFIEDKLTLIQKAILNHRKIIADYESNHQSLTIDRVLQPFGLAKKNQQWYLVAYCEMRQDYRVFKLSKFKKIEMIEEAFKVPPYFDLEAFWRATTNDFSIKENKIFDEGQSEISKPQYWVKVEGEPEWVRHLDGFELISVENKRYTFNMISEDVAMSQLILMCDQLKILSPLSLVNRIQRKAEGILQNILQLD